MSKYEQERNDAYNDLLTDGVMGQATLVPKSNYNPDTGKTTSGGPIVVNVPMLQDELADSVRYAANSLVTDKDVRLLVAALDDTGSAFELGMEHVLTFAGIKYKPKLIETIAPDGGSIMHEAIVSAL